MTRADRSGVLALAVPRPKHVHQHQLVQCRGLLDRKRHPDSKNGEILNETFGGEVVAVKSWDWDSRISNGDVFLNGSCACWICLEGFARGQAIA